MEENPRGKNALGALNSLIIHPEREPGVIDNVMLERSILANGPKEEAGRLFAQEGVHLDEAKVVRLEFKNILRIDHLWMLTSLTKLTLAHNVIEKIENLEQLTKLNELDLSFNKIEKIEKLDALVNLEVLTLFHNKIKKLENMEKLEKLLVFSIGDNMIENYVEGAYLRKFRNLRAVSFKGNPCCDDPMTYQFLAAALKGVTYLDYKIITEEERENGRTVFRGLLRKLDEDDEIKEKKRLAKEEYDKQVTFDKLSFVEYLNGPELLISMFEKDPDGSVLLTFGGELNAVFEKYKEEYVEIMDVLVKFAEDAYFDRQKEIKLFRDLMKDALDKNVEKCKTVLAEFKEKKKPLMEQVNEVVTNYRLKRVALHEVEPELTVLSEQFNEILTELWKILMTLEMQLFEQCEEARTTFGVNMTEKITKLQEVARNAFVEWREHETLWSMKQFETLSKYVGNVIILGDAVPELFEIMRDRDQLMNAVAQSTDNHMRFIDAREDVLATRAKAWRDELVKSTNDEEIQRNRDRILEINYFLDNQRIEWADLQMALHEPLDAETAALLGEDF